MIKRVISIAICILISLSLIGCWNYRGLNQMTIITGIAIDKTEEGKYYLSMEAVDTSSDKGAGTKAKMIECEGHSILDAFRNAKRRSTNKLYIGHAQLIIVSYQIAMEDGILSIMDLFLGDSETRETNYIVISQEITAKKLLSIYGMNNSIVSYEIVEIIDEDSMITLSTSALYIYEVYNIIKSDYQELSLAAFHVAVNDEIEVIELNGTAVFKSDKLTGYMDPFESKFFLFAIDEVKGGLLTFNYQDNIVTGEILESKTKISYKYEDGKFKFILKPKTTINIAEIIGEADLLDDKVKNDIIACAEEYVKQNITSIIYKLQTEFESDILGFGEVIYLKDPKLWNSVKGDWYKYFCSAEVEIQPEVSIENTAFLKKM